MNTDTEPDPIPTRLRRKPRPHETVCLGGRTKWRLDALCALGRRSRTATIDILIDEYLSDKPTLRAAVAERSSDPHPVQLKKRPEHRATAAT